MGSNNRDDEKKQFSEQVQEQAARKLKAQKKAGKNLWFGFGMFGLIGWSIVLPTLLGTGLVVWLDEKYPAHQHSWTLALLVAGLCIGCFNAVHWVLKERKAMLDEEKKDE